MVSRFFLTFLMVTMAGCTAAQLEEAAQYACDGIDNDGDGRIDEDCEDPVPPSGEGNEATCRNGIDDDYDTLIDCTDLDCEGTTYCRPGPEDSAAACDDGRDNDQDSFIDCLDLDCIDRGFCDAFVSPECDPITDDDDPDGCPFGMNCHIRPDGSQECRLVGDSANVELTPCSNDLAPEDPHPCARNYRCNNPYNRSSEGICQRVCDNVTFECGSFGVCRANDMFPISVCAANCDPRIGMDPCPLGWWCISGHQYVEAPSFLMGASYENGGAFFQCVPGDWGVMGNATLNQPCLEATTLTTPASAICAAGYMCMPDATSPSGAVCRVVCDATLNQGCSAGQICIPFYDGSMWLRVGFGSTEMGYCS